MPVTASYTLQVIVFLFICVVYVLRKCLCAQLYLTVYSPVDCSLPGLSVHGILQARILVWIAVPCSRGSSQPRNQTQVSCVAGGFFTTRATRQAQEYWSGWPVPSTEDPPTQESNCKVVISD